MSMSFLSYPDIAAMLGVIVLATVFAATKAWSYRHRSRPGGDAHYESDCTLEDDCQCSDCEEERTPVCLALGYNRRAIELNYRDDFFGDLADIAPEISFVFEDIPKGRLVAKLTAVIKSTPDGDSGVFEKLASANKLVFAGQGIFKKLSHLTLLSGPEVYDDERYEEFINQLKQQKGDEFRLCGADAFEGRQGEAGAFGTQAADTFLDGNKVSLYIIDGQDPTDGKDPYGRFLVAIVFPLHTEDGERYDIDYSALLIRYGCAIRYDGSKHVEGDWYQERYDHLQQLAEEESRGVWDLDPVPEMPHEWRKKNQKPKSNDRPRSSNPTAIRKFMTQVASR